MFRSLQIVSLVLALPFVTPVATTRFLQALDVLQPDELGGASLGDGAIDGCCMRSIRPASVRFGLSFSQDYAQGCGYDLRMAGLARVDGRPGDAGASSAT